MSSTIVEAGSLPWASCGHAQAMDSVIEDSIRCLNECWHLSRRLASSDAVPSTMLVALTRAITSLEKKLTWLTVSGFADGTAGTSPPPSVGTPLGATR